MIARLTDGWNAFWMRPANTSSLGLFRILLAVCLLYEARHGILLQGFAQAGAYQLPFLDYIVPPAPDVLWLVRALSIALVMLFGLGLFTRSAIAGLLLLRGYLFLADRLAYADQSYFFLLLLFLLLFSPCDEALSVQRYLRRRSGRSIENDGYLGPVRPMIFQRLIGIQVSIVYFYAALHKINVWYLSGNGLSRFASQHLLEGFSEAAAKGLLSVEAYARVTRIVEVPLYWVEPAFFSVLLELFLAFGLWFRRTRRLAIVVGVGYHLIIAFVAGSQFPLSLAMISSYFLFANPAWLPRTLAEAFGETDTTQPQHEAA